MLNILDFGAADDTLEEGRVALDRLEQQLRLRASNHTPDAQSETSSKLQSSVSRKKLDQLPRVARLNNRDESLGLTVEVSSALSTPFCRTVFDGHHAKNSFLLGIR
jgi:hypothetical protein